MSALCDMPDRPEKDAFPYRSHETALDRLAKMSSDTAAAGMSALRKWRLGMNLTPMAAARRLRLRIETLVQFEEGKGECSASLAMDIQGRTGGAVPAASLPGCEVTPGVVARGSSCGPQEDGAGGVSMCRHPAPTKSASAARPGNAPPQRAADEREAAGPQPPSHPVRVDCFAWEALVVDTDPRCMPAIAMVASVDGEAKIHSIMTANDAVELGMALIRAAFAARPGIDPATRPD